MKYILQLMLVCMPLIWITNCTKQEFRSIPTGNCDDINKQHGSGSCHQCTGNDCNGGSDGTVSALSYTVKACKADILFVVDNSGSMYSEQVELAGRFPNFLNALADLDYHIAVTTTDVSASPNNPSDKLNGYGAFWDGKLIKFPNGKYFIQNSDSSKQSEFEHTVEREETRGCDNGGPCPSGDERGVYAATLAVSNAASRGNLGSTKFFRTDSHLAVVVLSDENERSNGGSIADGYDLEAKDKPEALVNAVRGVFGASKLFSVHPIVVQSKLTTYNHQNDTSCNAIQNNQQSGIDFDRYGTIYEQLAVAGTALSSMGNIVQGFSGSICQGNFTSILQDIGEVINRNVGTIQLACKKASSVKVLINNVALSSSEYSIDSKNRVVLKTTPTCDESVTIKYNCPNNF